MATVIDSLIVELGLDPTKFTAGQKAILDQFKKTQEEAKKRGAEQEDMARKFSGTLMKVRNQAIGLVAALAGANSIKQFFVNTTSENANLDRTAKLLETNVETLSLWRNAARVAGGSAESMQKTIAGLSHEFQSWAATGQSGIIKWMRELKVEVADANGKMLPFQEILLQIIDKASRLDPARGAFLLRAIGVDEDSIALMLKGRVAVEEILNTVKGLGLVTAEAAAQASALESAWAKTSLAITGFFNRAVGAASPALIWLLDGIQRVLNPVGVREVNKMMAETRTGGSTAPEGLRSKSGSGAQSLGVSALAHSLQSSIPELKQFTAFDDNYHKGTGSKHERGLALDFTISDVRKARAVSSSIRERLRELGINGTVLDEYNNPSANSTGGHIHVQFNDPAAADKFRTGAGAAAGFGRGGGVTSIETNIDTINVNTQAKNASEIARDIRPILESRSQASKAQSGPL